MQVLRPLLFLVTAGTSFAQTAALPDAPGRTVVERVCGACHPATMVLGHANTREAWKEVVANMITRGAKGSPADFETITNYLATNLGPQASKAAAQHRTHGPAFSGPEDRPVIDKPAAARGRTLYNANCASCHGPLARGTDQGPDLVRSHTVLHDRFGDLLTPYLKEQHPQPRPSLTDAQIQDLAMFLFQQVEDTLRGGPFTKPLNVLTGNAQQGRAYFNGAGGCTNCHSITGDLAHIATTYDPATLQQRMLFPRAPAPGHVAPHKPTTVTVTQSGSQPVSGTLSYIDDFSVALRDANGDYHSWKRTPDLNVNIQDPYAAHDELLEHITDADIHNLVTYLETLK